MSSWFGPLGAGSTPALGRKQQAVLSFPQQVVQRQPGGGLPHDGGTEDACRAQEEEEQAGGDAIRAAQVGPTLAPAIEDKQLMADHRRFGNHGPESPWPCQSDHGDDHMDQQDHEVAHPGNSNNTSQAAVFRPISNSPWTRLGACGSRKLDLRALRYRTTRFSDPTHPAYAVAEESGD